MQISVIFKLSNVEELQQLTEALLYKDLLPKIQKLKEELQKLEDRKESLESNNPSNPSNTRVYQTHYDGTDETHW